MHPSQVTIGLCIQLPDECFSIIVHRIGRVQHTHEGKIIIHKYLFFDKKDYSYIVYPYQNVITLQPNLFTQ
jgi:hypothetical protein